MSAREDMPIKCLWYHVPEGFCWFHVSGGCDIHSIRPSSFIYFRDALAEKTHHFLCASLSFTAKSCPRSHSCCYLHQGNQYFHQLQHAKIAVRTAGVLSWQCLFIFIYIQLSLGS